MFDLRLSFPSSKLLLYRIVQESSRKFLSGDSAIFSLEAVKYASCSSLHLHLVGIWWVICRLLLETLCGPRVLGSWFGVRMQRTYFLFTLKKQMYRFVFYVTAVLTKHLICKSFLRVFHPTPEGPTKAQKKAAAITIQRFVPFFVHGLCLFIDLASRTWFPYSVTLLQLFFQIGHFWVPKTLTFEMRPRAPPFLWKWVLFGWKWKFISKSKAEHLTSFWYSGPGEPGNGLFATLEARGKLGRVNLRKDFWDCH